MQFTKITEIPLGPINVQAWGLLVGLGMLVGLFFALAEAKRKGINKESIYDVFLISVISSMIGGRIMYVALYWQNFKYDLLGIFKIWHGGMVFFGGFLAALAGVIIYARIKKIKFWRLADTLVPGLAIGLFIGRMGCFLIGDHIGAPIEYFGIGSYFGSEDFLRHEVSAYMSLKGLILFIILWSLRKKLKHEGDLTLVFLAGYSVLRFGIDFLRANDLAGYSDPRFWGGMTISQYICIAILGFAIIKLFYKQK
ncbi:prolipoprotein diacylglyceryl transferase [Candidatus Peregrinibacteria bacterium RIFOXYB2_FULL_41_88]|nr:MAG: prolipoprotein diacylglyceryl transferase [Candidatus Peregrinibacteria bacterium RIFOXYB2_FULL_41_88]